MRAASVGLISLAMVAATSVCAQTAPTPATPGPNPGQSATDAITNQAKPPADIAPSIGSAPGTAAPASPISPVIQTPLPDTTRPDSSQPTRPDGRQGRGDAPGRTTQVQYGAPQGAAGGGSMNDAQMRELLAAARDTAKATRESVDYGRVVPDILTQVLAKLDKIEDKLDKVELAVRAGPTRRR